MTEPKDALTGGDLSKEGRRLEPLIKKTEQALTVLKAKQTPYHDKAHTALTKRTTEFKDSLVNRLGDLKGKPKSELATVAKDLTAIQNDIKTALDKKVTTTFYLGTKSYANVAALTAAVKSKLTDPDAGHASQAVSDAVSNTSPKDASKVGGPGVKHASAGVKATNSSCTVFFKRETLDDGLEERLTIVAVGSHAGPSSYKIVDSSIPAKLKVDKVVSL